MPRRNGPGEARGPRAPRIPDRRRAQRRQTLPLDKGEPHERRRVLQADVLRNREPPLPPDDARSGRVQPGVPVLLADARVGIEFSPGGGRSRFHCRRIDSRTTRTADGVQRQSERQPGAVPRGMAPDERRDQSDGRADVVQATRRNDRRVQASQDVDVPRDERDDAGRPATDAFGRPSPDAALRDRSGAERGDLPEARRREVRSRVEQAPRDTRPPPDAADSDRRPAYAGGRLEPRLGGRVRGTGPTREADVHRVQRIQLRWRKPAAAPSGERPQPLLHSDVRGTTRGSHRLSDRGRARGQPRGPAHPGRRAPPYFAMRESTAAAFITRIGYDAEGRGGPPPDPV